MRGVSSSGLPGCSTWSTHVRGHWVQGQVLGRLYYGHRQPAAWESLGKTCGQHLGAWVKKVQAAGCAEEGMAVPGACDG